MRAAGCEQSLYGLGRCACHKDAPASDFTTATEWSQ